MHVKHRVLIMILAVALILGAMPALADSYVSITGGNANLRTGPGLSYDSMKTITDGDTATYLGDSSVDDRGVTWYKVKHGNSTGWVSSKYAVLHESSASSGSSSSGSSSSGFDFLSGSTSDSTSNSTSSKKYVRVTGGDANLRKGPGLSYDSLKVIPERGTATYLDDSSVDDRGVTWYYVDYNGIRAWISSKYAKLTDGEPSATYARISGGSANLRKGPGLSYDSIKAIPEGGSATYLNDSSVDDRGVTWYYVNYNGTKGWVSSKYAKLR